MSCRVLAVGLIALLAAALVVIADDVNEQLASFGLELEYRPERQTYVLPMTALLVPHTPHSSPDGRQWRLHCTGLMYSLSSSDFAVPPANGTAFLTDSSLVQSILAFAQARGHTVDNATLIERLLLFKARAVKESSVELYIKGVAAASEHTYPHLIYAHPDSDPYKISIVTDGDGFFNASVPVTFGAGISNASVVLSPPARYGMEFPSWPMEFGVPLTFDDTNHAALRNFSHTQRMASVRFYSPIRALPTVNPFEPARAIVGDGDGDRSRVVTDTSLTVISDIDVSNITGEWDDLLKLTLFQPYATTAGMKELYRQWATQTPQFLPDYTISAQLKSIMARTGMYSAQTSVNFYYVSGSPWPLRHAYTRFLEEHFPAGSLHVPSVLPLPSPTNVTVFDQNRMRKSRVYRHKYPTINTIVESTRGGVILVGDSTEYDAEIYADVARTWGFRPFGNATDKGRIACVLMRFTPKITEADSEMLEELERSQRPRMGLRDFWKILWPGRDTREVQLRKRALQHDQRVLREMEQYRVRVDKMFADIPGYRDRVRVFRDGRDLANVMEAKAPWNCLQ